MHGCRIPLPAPQVSGTGSSGGADEWPGVSVSGPCPLGVTKSGGVSGPPEEETAARSLPRVELELCPKEARAPERLCASIDGVDHVEARERKEGSLLILGG